MEEEPAQLEAVARLCQEVREAGLAEMKVPLEQLQAEVLRDAKDQIVSAVKPEDTQEWAEEANMLSSDLDTFMWQGAPDFARVLRVAASSGLVVRLVVENPNT